MATEIAVATAPVGTAVALAAEMAVARIVATEIAVATVPVGTPVALAAEMAVARIVAAGTQVAIQIDRTHE